MRIYLMKGIRDEIVIRYAMPNIQIVNRITVHIIF